MASKKGSSRDKDIDGIIGAKIRRIRQERGLTQTEVGQLLGVTFQQIQKYESGRASSEYAHGRRDSARLASAADEAIVWGCRRNVW